MESIDLNNFNHELTLLGGQSFSWDHIGDTSYVGVFQDDIIKVNFDESKISFSSLKNDSTFVNEYFRLTEDYENILKIISDDEHVQKAIEWAPNIRLLKQPFEMTVLSYVLSANNGITMINRSIRMLNQMLGEKVTFEGETYSLFPTAEAIANTSEEKLREAKIGFRAKYLKQVAERLVDSSLSQVYSSLSENEIRAELTNMPGIGEKIADCVVVFSLGANDITPVDVWVKRILHNIYGVSEKLKPAEYRDWLRLNFGGYGAWAGQFLFEWYRKTYKKQ